MRAWGRRFMLSMQFMMRIPFRFELHLHPKDFGASTVFFPCIGACIGLVMVAFAQIGMLTASTLVAAAFAVTSYAIISGAKFIDGFAYFCQRGRKSEKSDGQRNGGPVALSIRGKVAVVIDLLLQTCFFWLLFDLNDWPYALCVILIASVGSNFSLNVAGLLSSAADLDDPWFRFINGVSPMYFSIATLVTFCLLLIVCGWQIALLIMAWVALLSAAIVVPIQKRRNGITDAVIGLLHECTMLGVLILLFTMQKLQWLSVSGLMGEGKEFFSFLGLF